MMKRVLIVALAIVIVMSSLLLAGCNGNKGALPLKPTTTTTTQPQPEDTTITKTVRIYNFDPITLEAGDYTEREITYDGVIRIGNTNDTTTQSGMAYNLGLWSYINTINYNGGIGGDYENGKRGYYIELVEHAGKDAEEHPTYTKKLVEEDRVFAIVGQLSDIATYATINYIIKNDIVYVGPSVGDMRMYNVDKGNYQCKAIFPVQPLSTVQGIYIAKCIYEMYPDCEKIGILNAADVEGEYIAQKVMFQLDLVDMGDRCVEVEYNWDDYSFDADSLRDCDVIVVAACETNSAKLIRNMIDENIAKPVFIADMLPGSEVYKEYSESAALYVTNWFDTTDTEDYVEFMCGMASFGVTTMPDGEQYLNNRYAMEGWIVADVFCEGLRRIAQQGGRFAKWEYISAMESEPIKLKMVKEFVNGYSYDGKIFYDDGYRVGTVTLGLMNADFEQVIALQDITPRVP